MGTRAAAYAPVSDLGLVAVWDDGSDLHEEPHAPYANVRDVLVLRAHLAGAGALIGGHLPSVEAVSLAAIGLVARAGRAARHASAVAGAAGRGRRLRRAARPVTARPRRRGCRIWRSPPSGRRWTGAARRSSACRAAVTGRRVACDNCRTAARCPALQRARSRKRRSIGSASPAAGAPPSRGARLPGVRSPALAGGRRRQHPHRRRAGPRLPGRHGGALQRSRRSSTRGPGRPRPWSSRRLGQSPSPMRVTARCCCWTPGPLLGRADLRAGEEALRRWMNASALARPGPEGGRVVLVGARRGLPRCRRWCAGTRSATPSARLPSRAELGIPAGQPHGGAGGRPRRRRGVPGERRAARPTPTCSVRCRSVRRIQGSNADRCVRVPRAQGAALAAPSLQSAHRSVRAAVQEGAGAFASGSDPAEIGLRLVLSCTLP